VDRHFRAVKKSRNSEFLAGARTSDGDKSRVSESGATPKNESPRRLIDQSRNADFREEQRF
jgi:hypothetical protein